MASAAQRSRARRGVPGRRRACEPPRCDAPHTSAATDRASRHPIQNRPEEPTSCPAWLRTSIAGPAIRRSARRAGRRNGPETCRFMQIPPSAFRRTRNTSTLVPFERAPPRRRPGSSFARFVVRGWRLSQSSPQLGPGLRRGRARGTCSNGISTEQVGNHTLRTTTFIVPRRRPGPRCDEAGCSRHGAPANRVRLGPGLRRGRYVSWWDTYRTRPGSTVPERNRLEPLAIPMAARRTRNTSTLVPFERAPPRRRPGPSFDRSVVRGWRLSQSPPQLGPGLRLGRARGTCSNEISTEQVAIIPFKQIPHCSPAGGRGPVAMKQVVAGTAPPQTACERVPASAGEGTCLDGIPTEHVRGPRFLEGIAWSLSPFRWPHGEPGTRRRLFISSEYLPGEGRGPVSTASW